MRVSSASPVPSPRSDGSRPCSNSGGCPFCGHCVQADKAIAWINQQKALAPDKPVFVYYSPGTAHAPHRFFCSIKQFRRIATRYEKTATSFAAMLCLAGAMVWLR